MDIKTNEMKNLIGSNYEFLGFVRWKND